MHPLPKAPPRKDSTQRRKRVKTAILTATPKKDCVERQKGKRGRTKHQHSILSTSAEELAKETLNSDTDSSASDSEDEESEAIINFGKFVKFAGKQNVLGYVGRVIASECLEWTIDFYKSTPRGTDIKPANENMSNVSADQIVKKGAPVSTSKTARTLGSVSLSDKSALKENQLQLR